MSLRHPTRTIAAVAGALTLMLCATASAATTETFPAAGNARTFATSAGGWTGAVTTSCITPGVGCPDATATYRPTGGAGGANDGHLRSSFTTPIGVVAATATTWTSPNFTATQPADAGTLSVGVRSDVGRLLGVGGTIRLSMTLVDNQDASRNVVLASGLDVPDTTTFAPLTAPVPAGALAPGRSYHLELRARLGPGVSVLGSGNVDYDNVTLDSVDLLPPSGLTATADTSGPLTIRGSVNPAGQATTVVADYGPTASYGSSTPATVVNGTGTQSFAIPLAGLTPGSTVHYRVRATNADGPVSTADATFVVPAAPFNAPPALSGALNSRTRTVSYDVTTGTAAVRAEVLRGGTVVTTADDPTPTDGTMAITLPDSDGAFDVRLVRTNASGGSSTSAAVSTTLDRVAPSTAGIGFTVTPVVSGARERTVSFTPGSDVTSADAQVIDAAGTPVGAPVPTSGGRATVLLGATDGDYRVRLTLRDAAGNEATATSSVVTLDSQAPGAGDAPVITGAGNSRDRQVTFDRDPSTVTARVEVYDGQGVLKSSQPAAGNTAAVTLPDADGTYWVRVVQSDSAGNEADSPFATTTLDRQPPSAGGPPAVTGAGNSRTRQVSFDRDPSTATAVIEVLNAAGTVVDSQTVTGSTGAVTLGTAEGDYRVRVRQTDAAGNSAVSLPTTVTLDLTPPVASGAPRVTGSDDSRTRHVVFDRDPSASVATIEVRDASGVLRSSTPATGSAGDITLPDLDGSYAIRVVLVDVAGNQSASPSVTVILDRTPAPGPDPTPTPNPNPSPTPAPNPNPTPPDDSDSRRVRTLTDTEIRVLQTTLAWTAETGRLTGGSVVPGRRCTIVGTKKADTLRGTKGNDVICGLGGNDKIVGGGGNDIIDGGSGSDRIDGGAGNDTVLGLAGNDRVSGSSGADRLSGGAGKDRLSGGSGKDRLAGGSGNDRFSTRDRKKDRLSGGTGRDRAVADRGLRVSRGVRDGIKGIERVR